MPSFDPQKEKGTISNVFQTRYSPGSTMKPILAAAALSIQPGLLEGGIYNCSKGNHRFPTDEGKAYQINCAGNTYHGRVMMADAIAYSCNGYFVSLLTQLPREELAKELSRWGFGTTVAFDQFAYWDHTFANEDCSGGTYLLSAIGQGDCSITPIGMNLCTNVLLNSGRLEEPQFILEESDSPDSEMENRRI